MYVLKQVPRLFQLLRDNAATLFYCETPEMFCGLQRRSVPEHKAKTLMSLTEQFITALCLCTVELTACFDVLKICIVRPDELV